MNEFDTVSFQARHIYICEHHKNMIQSVRSKRKRKDSDDETEMTEVRDLMLSSFSRFPEVFIDFSSDLVFLDFRLRLHTCTVEPLTFDGFLFVLAGRFLSASGKHVAAIQTALQTAN